VGVTLMIFPSLVSLWARDDLPVPLLRLPRTRTRIADEAASSLSAVLIEGCVAASAASEEMTAPLSGARCVYHRVSVHQALTEREPFDSPWCTLYGCWRLTSFSVSDASGSVLVQPSPRPDSDPRLAVEDGSDDPVVIDRQLFSRVVIH